MGHIRMMGAVQPFLSGAISKTVNLPTDATVEDIEEAYLEAWKLGLKAIAVYRDGCKRTQPLNTGKDEKEEAIRAVQRLVASAARAARASCPTSAARSPTSSRSAATRATSPSACTRTARRARSSSRWRRRARTISGLMDSFATSISLALQYGVPLKVLCDKFSHTRFEPSGFTGNPEIPIAKSIDDGLQHT